MSWKEFKKPIPRPFTSYMPIYHGGEHEVACPGDGFHYWLLARDGKVFQKADCSDWLGGCPAERVRRGEQKDSLRG